MLRINRLRVEINTVKGVYGIDKALLALLLGFEAVYSAAEAASVLP